MRLRVDGYWRFDRASSQGAGFTIPQNCFGEGVQVQNLIEPTNFYATIWQSWNDSRTMPLSTEMVFQSLLRVDIFLAHLFRVSGGGNPPNLAEAIHSRREQPQVQLQRHV